MKKIKTLLMLPVLLTSPLAFAQVGIGTATPDISAALDITSTEQGFLPPRMTTAERDAINGGTVAEGLVIYNTETSCLEFRDQFRWVNACTGKPQEAGATDVYNSETGRIWMDRNLGASQVATSSADAGAFGDLYQWGRPADGHESRASGTTTTLSSSSNPGHADFIMTGGDDWLSPSDDNLWQGVSGANNPCPAGYRLPTDAEWDAERQSWSSDNAAGAFASPLKLPVAGYRERINGNLVDVGSIGYYWASTVSGASTVRGLDFDSGASNLFTNARSYGFSVRCIMDE